MFIKTGELTMSMKRKNEMTQIALISLKEAVRKEVHLITEQDPTEERLDCILSSILNDSTVRNTVINSITYHLHEI